MTLHSKLEVSAALNKTLRTGFIPTEFQNALTTEGNGAFLIPTELKSDIETAKKYNKAMSQYVDVVTVTSAQGRYSTEDEGNHGELYNFTEGVPITEQDMNLKGVSWDLENYGSFTPLSEDLYNDAGFSLIKFFENAHAEKSTKTENKLIFNEIRASLITKALANVGALKTSLNKDLNPGIEKEIIIVTNQDGYEVLDNLDVIENVKQEDGSLKRFIGIYPLEVHSNDDLPSLLGNAPFIYGSFKRSVKLFTTNKVSVRLVKNPYGLSKTLHIVRGVEDNDVKVIPLTTQLIYGEIPIV